MREEIEKIVKPYLHRPINTTTNKREHYGLDTITAEILQLVDKHEEDMICGERIENAELFKESYKLRMENYDLRKELAELKEKPKKHDCIAFQTEAMGCSVCDANDIIEKYLTLKEKITVENIVEAITPDNDQIYLLDIKIIARIVVDYLKGE
jgi:hypothetical protein